MNEARRLLNCRQVAQRLGMGDTTFWELRNRDKTFPKPFILNGKKRFDSAEVEEWLAGKREQKGEAA